MYTEITTIEQAFEQHPAKINLQKVEEALSFLPAEFSIGMISLLKGQVVTDVLNNDDPNELPFDPDYNNSQQKKRGLWFVGGDASGSGFRFLVDDWSYSNSSSYGGARLALKDSPRAQHMANHFTDVHKGIYLKLKQ